MAKYVKTMENGNIKHELTFRGKTYDYTMEKTSYGHCANKKDFTDQLENDGFILTTYNGEQLDIDSITYDTDCAVFEILEMLEEME